MKEDKLVKLLKLVQEPLKINIKKLRKEFSKVDDSGKAFRFFSGERR